MSARPPAHTAASSSVGAAGRTKSRNHSETEADSHVNECGEAEFEQLLATAARPRYRTSSAHTQHNQFPTGGECGTGGDCGGAPKSGTGALTRRSLQVLNRLFHAADNEAERADFLAQRAGVTGGQRPAAVGAMPVPARRAADTVVQVDDAIAFPLTAHFGSATGGTQPPCDNDAHKHNAEHCECHGPTRGDRSVQHAAVAVANDDVPFIDDGGDVPMEVDSGPENVHSPRSPLTIAASTGVAITNSSSGFTKDFIADESRPSYTLQTLDRTRRVKPANEEMEMRPLNERSSLSPQQDDDLASRAGRLEQGRMTLANRFPTTLHRPRPTETDTNTTTAATALSLAQINGGAGGAPGRHYGSNRAYTQRGHRPAKPTKRAYVRKDRNVKGSVKAEEIEGHMGGKALEDILRSFGVQEDSVKVTKVTKKPAGHPKKTLGTKRRPGGTRVAGADDSSRSSGSSSPEPAGGLGAGSYTSASSGVACDEADDAQSAASAPVCAPRHLQPPAGTLDLDDARLYMADNELPPADLLQPAVPVANAAVTTLASTPTDFIPVVHPKRTRKQRLGGRHSFGQTGQAQLGSDSDAAGPLVSPPLVTGAGANRPPPARRRNSSGGEPNRKADQKANRKQRVPSKPPSEPGTEPGERRVSDVSAMSTGGAESRRGQQQFMQQRQQASPQQQQQPQQQPPPPQQQQQLQQQLSQHSGARSASSASMSSRPSYSSMAASGKRRQDQPPKHGQPSNAYASSEPHCDGPLSPRSTASADDGAAGSLLPVCSSDARLQTARTGPVRVVATAVQEDQCKYSSSPNLTSDDFPPPPLSEDAPLSPEVVTATAQAGPSWAKVASKPPKPTGRLHVQLGAPATAVEEQTISDGEKTPTAVAATGAEAVTAPAAPVAPPLVAGALLEVQRSMQECSVNDPPPPPPPPMGAANVVCDAAVSLVTSSDGAASITLGGGSTETSVPSAGTPVVEFAHDDDDVPMPTAPDDAPYEFGWDPSMPTADVAVPPPCADLTTLQSSSAPTDAPAPQWVAVTPPPTPGDVDSNADQQDDPNRQSPAGGVIQWTAGGALLVSAPLGAPLPLMPSGSSVSVADAATGAVATNFAAVHVPEAHLRAARYLYTHWRNFIDSGEPVEHYVLSRRP